MDLSLFSEIDNICKYCTKSHEECKCELFWEKNKTYSGVEEICVKGKKWVTIVYMKAKEPEFRAMKKPLGTGGKFFKDKLVFRGRISSRVKILLSKLGYIKGNIKS